MQLSIQLIILFAFILLFYSVIIVTIINAKVIGPTGIFISPIHNPIRLKNISTGKYLALRDNSSDPVLIISDNPRDPITLFRIIYSNRFITLQSIYNGKFLSIDGKTSSIDPITNKNFSFIFHSDLMVEIITSSGLFVSSSCNEIILQEQSSTNSQWILE